LEQYRAALRALEQLPKEDVVPELRETLLTQASAQLTKAKCHEEVKQVLTSPLARSAPFTATLHFSLGLAYMGTGEFAEAASQMRLCLEKLDTPTLTPINPEVRKGGPRHCLAVCLSKVGQPEEAEQEFRTALSEKPDSVKTAVEFARHLISVGRAVDALQELHNFVSQVPGAAAAWEFGARIALGHPEFLEVALDWTAEAQRLHPEHPEILLLRAETLVLAGNTKDALDLCRSGKVSTVALGSALTTACEASHQELLTTIEARQENNVSSEFLKLYRKLLTFNASEVVGRINTRLEELSQVLPSAASNLRAALTEAGLEPVQSTKML
jgi:tetratricopeptide (TPR) repeat protein